MLARYQLDTLFLLVLLGAAAAAYTQVQPQLAERYFKGAATLCERDAGRLWGVSLCGPLVIVDQASGTRATSQPEPAGPTPRFSGFADGPVARGGVRWFSFPLSFLPEKDAATRQQVMLHGIEVMGLRARKTRRHAISQRPSCERVYWDDARVVSGRSIPSTTVTFDGSWRLGNPCNRGRIRRPEFGLGSAQVDQRLFGRILVGHRLPAGRHVVADHSSSTDGTTSISPSSVGPYDAERSTRSFLRSTKSSIGQEETGPS